MSALQKLPAGNPIFAEIREKGYLYVDKTRYLPELINIPNKIVFCSRPRRFGKSLTVSTLEAFYGGRKNLFRRLDVEKYMNSGDFQPRPVIKLDMSAVMDFNSRDELRGKLLRYLQDIAQNFNLTLRDPDPELAFYFLTKDLSQKEGNPVVVLIDEYDAPVLNTLSKPALLEEARKVMRVFYTQIKVAYQHICFAFITGVSKFSKMGVFSSLNNLYDISLDPEFAAMMGYTHEEFKEYFKPYFEGLSQKTGVAAAELLEKIEGYYNGFSFDGETRVYNPFSTLSLLQRGVFDNYWMESGSTSFIRNFLKEKKLTVDQFRNLPVQRSFLTSPGEIESTPPYGFLYQAGYLTLRKKEDEYFLDYPNFEVLSAMSAYCIQNMLREDDVAGGLFKNVRSAVDKQDAVTLVKVFNLLFASISYDDHRRNSNESFYRATLQAFFLGAGIRADIEVPNNLGRSDIVAQYKDKTVVIELKRVKRADASAVRLQGVTDEDSSDDAQTVVKASAVGMGQILEKEYGNAYASALRLACAIDADRRRIGAYSYIAPGSSEVIEGVIGEDAADGVAPLGC
jgi:hypothetical protein